MIGNHLPRQCGIATFTTHLSQAIGVALPEVECYVLAMNDVGHHHDYPSAVRFEIDQGELASYRRAADFLNVNTFDVVCLQHEYGIFGGRAGSHLITLLRALRMPIVTTLHTILAEPSDDQRAVMDHLIELSDRLVVMSEHATELMQSVHGVPAHKIDVIPHGIPELPPSDVSKGRVGVEGQRVLLTFGLLSPDKGIEYVIDALPKIIERVPDTVYIVLGATHPHVRENEGETYRRMLEARGRKLGVESNVIFHNRFVSQAELNDFLSAADVYVTPYLKIEQITSGTLAYAVGSGKAVISTPYWYAQELLKDGRGSLVPPRDSAAIAAAASELLCDDAKRASMCRRAAAYGENMTWPAVASEYGRSFERARIGHAAELRNVFKAHTLASRPAELPEISWNHLRQMTDGTGLLQHAAFNMARCEDGYSIDDNARGLAVVALAEEAGSKDRHLIRDLGSRYLAFVRYAWNPAVGRFRNFMAYDRSLSSDLFHAALPALPEFTSPRAWAFSPFWGSRSTSALSRGTAAWRTSASCWRNAFLASTGESAPMTGPGSKRASPIAVRASPRP